MVNFTKWAGITAEPKSLSVKLSVVLTLVNTNILTYF